MQSQVVDQLKDIAQKFRCQLELEATSDGSYIDGILTKEHIDLGVAIPKRNDTYFAYTLHSTVLPLEIYPDNISDGFTEEARSQEVLGNIENILAKKVVFHKTPKLINKEAGFIILPVDGKPTKLHQKKNYFDLPLG